MSNRGYERGRRFEWLRKKAWEAQGYVVLRTAGSHGFADLLALDIAASAEPVECIQCKVAKTKTEAQRLIRTFVEKPPLPKSSCYRQRIEVSVPRQGIFQGVVDCEP